MSKRLILRKILGLPVSILKVLARLLGHPLPILAVILLSIFWNLIPMTPYDSEIESLASSYLFTVFLIRFYRKLISIKRRVWKVSFLLALPIFFIILSAIAALLPENLKSGANGVVITLVLSFCSLPLLWIILHLKQIFKAIGRGIVWPFRSGKNFGVGLLIVFIIFYFLTIEYRLYHLYGDKGGYDKLFCSEPITKIRVGGSVVRIIGTYGQGSGFFIAPTEVITNFHVIEGETSPKVILPNGKFLVPEKIRVYEKGDLAVIHVSEPHTELVLGRADAGFTESEPLLAIGFPLGTYIKGSPTVVRGNFLNYRELKGEEVEYIQTSIPLVNGMSGGPAVDLCGKVVGVNTMAVSGMSFLVRLNQSSDFSWYNFVESEQTKLELDPSISPEEAVRAFYTYLKVRRMDDGFNLLSSEYKKKTNIDEWTNRFPNVIDVYIWKIKPSDKKDQVFVQFDTTEWIDGGTQERYYEGTWDTVKEDGVYKLLRSKILDLTPSD